jgi:hypothetical protein
MMRQRTILGAQGDASLSQVMRLRRPRPILRKQSEGGGGGSEPPTCIRSFRGFYENYQKRETCGRKQNESCGLIRLEAFSK